MNHQRDLIASESSLFDSADGSLNYSICLKSTWSGRVMRSTHFVASSKTSRLLSVWIVLGFSIQVTESFQTHHVALFWTSIGK